MSLYENTLAQIEKAAKVADIEESTLTRIRQPERILEVNFPYETDHGDRHILKGFRVQHSTARGPAKGGIRFHPMVDMSEVKALAAWMSMKCAVADLPLGGGKGGVIVDPHELSINELESLTRNFTRSIAPIIGPDKDVPAPDVYTNSQTMDWIADEFEKITGDSTGAVITGKSLENGGSEGRDTATAQGGVYVLEAFVEEKGLKPEDLTVAIQGFGNAGLNAAKLLSELGYKVVAVSDSQGGAVCRDGLDVSRVVDFKLTGNSVSNFICEGGAPLSNEELLEYDVDILVLSALENQITSTNAEKIRAKYILELANGPIHPEAEEVLLEAGVVIFPDILANAGGVTVSCYEWQQNLQGIRWTRDEILEKLKKQMIDAYNDVLYTAREFDTDLRTAAFILAIRRIEKEI